MSRSNESLKTGPLLESLQQEGYFRKLSDRFQIGMPDIIGCYKGLYVGIEVKEVSVIAEGGMAPSLSGHVFTKAQVKELKQIEANGGIAIAIVLCGDKAFWFTPDQITGQGQVNCIRSMDNGCVVKKEHGKWNVHPVLEFLHGTAGFREGKKSLLQ